MNLRQRLRASHVKRWHIVETIRNQSVAEHSFNVALIAEEMATLLGMTDSEIDAIHRIAIHHDIPEAVLGDTPTPTKLAMEQRFADKMNALSEVLDGKSAYNCSVSSRMLDILKISDMLDAVLFLAVYGVGKHAEIVRGEIVGAVWDKAAGMDGTDYFKLQPFLLGMISWETAKDTGEGVING